MTKHRLNIPDETDIPESNKTMGTFGEWLSEVFSHGRSVNPKRDLLESILNDPSNNVTDKYVFLRTMKGTPFGDPHRTLDFDRNVVRDAIAEVFFDGSRRDYDSFEDEHGSVSGVLKQEGLSKGGSTLISDAYSALFELKDMSSEASIRERLEELFWNMQSPWAFTFLMFNDLSPYFGGSYIRDVYQRVYHVSESDIERAYGVLNDTPMLVFSLEDGELKTHLEPHDYMGTMKAKTWDAEDVANCETDAWVGQTKYDGARIFVHHSGDGDVRVYSGGMRDVTEAIPEIQELDLPEFPFIFDGELTPYDADTGEVLPFQEIMTRLTRTGGVEEARESVEVEFKFFDCPHWRGDDITKRTQEDRFQLVTGTFAPPHVAQQGSDLEATFQRSIEDGHEGIVLKRRSSRYEPWTRSSSWRKWKAEPDTLDFRIIEAHRGSGRISDRLGALQLGLRLPSDEILDVGRVGTGFSDEERLELWKLYEEDRLIGKFVEVDWEELQYSSGNWGIRFPRFVRMRLDAEVDTLERAARLADMESEYEEYIESEGAYAVAGSDIDAEIRKELVTTDAKFR